MNKQKLTILQVIKRGGIAKKTGNAWEIHAAQCVLEQSFEGETQILVGTINLPDQLKAIQPGDYLAEFAFSSPWKASSNRASRRLCRLG